MSNTHDPIEIHLIENSTKPGLSEQLVKSTQTPIQINMMLALQTSLDIHSLIDVFFHHLRQHMPVEGMIFQNINDAIHINFGKETSFRLNYQLSIQNHHLGSTTLFQNKPFTEFEIQELESLLMLLLLPLRNALSHYEALQSALIDPLTGVLNRTTMIPTLNREIDLARRHQADLAILALDLDDFKKINDHHGHAAGDVVLKSFAQTLNQCIRDSDIIFRAGGEEFVTILSKTSEQGAEILTDRICQKIRSLRCKYKSKELTVTVSIGIAMLKQDESSSTLLEKADEAMYRAKRNGKDGFSF